MARQSTSRQKVGTYQGYSIIRVVTTYQSSYKRDLWYEFCKAGDEHRPSQHYDVYAESAADCKKRIDEFINDDTTCFTAAEMQKYVDTPNRKCGYGYGYNSLMRLMREHQKASKRIKLLLCERLDDANFHHESALLSEENYDEFANFVRKKFKFREKFEVITETEAKRIKNPKELEDGLARVISEYLAQQGRKDTSVKVKFIEEW